jgi:hypothetical protein
MTCGAGNFCDQDRCVDPSCDLVDCAANEQCAAGGCFTLEPLSSCVGADCSCDAGAQRPCYPTDAGLSDPTLGVGICRAGTSVCAERDGGTFWSTCLAAQVPRAEQCNGLDDDCDGTIDRGCPTGIAYMGGTVSRLFGKSDGGNPFTLACPVGQVLYGLDIITSAGYGVYSLRLRCGTLQMVTADGGTVITRTPGSVLGPIGWTMPPSPTMLGFDCNPGVITGVFGKEGGQQGNFGVACSRLGLDGAPGSVTLTMEDGGSSPPQGTVPVSTPFSFTCPPPQIAGTFFGFAGAWIDKFGVQCTSPTLLLKP